jgi:hypothetical protein
MRHYRIPTEIIMDAYTASHRAVADLKAIGELSKRAPVRRSKYLTTLSNRTTVPDQDAAGVASRPLGDGLTFWQYCKPGGESVFDFYLGRGREGPPRVLGKFEGILPTDGYQAYVGVVGPKLVHVGCWAHSRRKFVDAVKVQPEDGDAVKIVARIDALFLVEREASKVRRRRNDWCSGGRTRASGWAGTRKSSPHPVNAGSI